MIWLRSRGPTSDSPPLNLLCISRELAIFNPSRTPKEKKNVTVLDSIYQSLEKQALKHFYCGLYLHCQRIFENEILNSIGYIDEKDKIPSEMRSAKFKKK